MKEELLTLLSGKEGYNLKVNTLREYLQAFMLRILFKNNFFQHTAFLGGTCLRFIHAIKRFSEDLDFSLLDASGFDYHKIVQTLSKELADAGYQVLVKTKSNSIYSSLFKFSDLLNEAGISNRRGENISIKIDLDTHPPAEAKTEKHIINRYFMVGVTSYDLSTLLAGKINALLTRNYAKGRDYYDLFWYLTTHKKLEPNFPFLKNALAQFNWQGNMRESRDWKIAVFETLQGVDWEKIQKEMELLIEDRESLALFTRENIIMLLNL